MQRRFSRWGGFEPESFDYRVTRGANHIYIYVDIYAYSPVYSEFRGQGLVFRILVIGSFGFSVQDLGCRFC